eukprot:m.476657 g.476657  ORF g.476657 m.476657 type:complete len:257 (-) comp20607_c0_seq1:105-875(-)
MASPSTPGDSSSDFEMVENDAPPAAAGQASGHCCPALQGVTLKNLKTSFPPKVRQILYYENPIHSAVAIALVLGTLVFLNFDFGFSLLWLSAWIARWMLVVTLAITGVSYLAQRFGKLDQPILTKFVEPHVDHIGREIGAYLPTVDEATAMFNKVVAHIPGTLTCFKNLLLCKNPIASVKALVQLYLVVETVGCLFSGCTLAFLGAIAVFTVPFVFDKYEDKISPVLDTASAKITGVLEQVCSKLPASLKCKTKEN